MVTTMLVYLSARTGLPAVDDESQLRRTQSFSGKGTGLKSKGSSFGQNQATGSRLETSLSTTQIVRRHLSYDI